MDWVASIAVAAALGQVVAAVVVGSVAMAAAGSVPLLTLAVLSAWEHRVVRSRSHR